MSSISRFQGFVVFAILNFRYLINIRKTRIHILILEEIFRRFPKASRNKIKIIRYSLKNLFTHKHYATT
jgi:hypothetical protein